MIHDAQDDYIIHGPQSSGHQAVGPVNFSTPEDEPTFKEYGISGLGLGEATDLPASPRSPLLFPYDEATELPASPQTPPPSSSLGVILSPTQSRIQDRPLRV